ncbi:hypothetical protein [Methanosarcina sp.]|uniref:hypothetical protein n=2 Tax=Methanosarcina TaxID=2207 RepID=UPI002988EFA9|nr:hypothetical protein [Methanosarcina sp.]MDW5560222.1 hypothetical protein [Methanosarcina sp.]
MMFATTIEEFLNNVFLLSYGVMQLTDSKTDIQRSNNSSKFPSINKRTIIRTYIVIIWLMIAQILLIVTERVSYEDIKYFFWTESVLVPLLYVLYTKGVPDQLSREQEKEQKREIFVLVFSFACMVMVIFMAMLNGY